MSMREGIFLTSPVFRWARRYRPDRIGRMIEPHTHTSVRAPQITLLVINIALLVGFGIVFAIRRNYEFITYVVVVGGVIAVLVGSMRRVNYTLDTLIAMTVWAALDRGEPTRLFLRVRCVQWTE